jgi:hypothetical protein
MDDVDGDFHCDVQIIGDIVARRDDEKVLLRLFFIL